MIEHLVTRLEAARLDLRQRELRRGEEAAIARLGEKTLADGGARSGRLATLAAEAATARGRLQSATAALGTSSSGARRRLAPLEQKLYQIHLTAGRLALALPPTGAESEVHAIRAEIADAESRRDRLRGEGHRLVQETWSRVRSWIGPRAPELTAALLGWFIARSYAVSNTGAILSSLGLSPSQRGPHLVGMTTDTRLVQYGMPVVAAALAAAVAHRLAGRVRTAVEKVRERTSQASGDGAAARLAPPPGTRRL